ncbi:site-specific integrase [uncultured Psychrobacter sp.]|mgnify:FL=1|uniref:site-specific integrase n=1 Tax=uncultured Psychrobacter sp. TaxID=259303 RepID=UPI0030D9FECA|tara:strand:- start:5261 stop:8470 length:3210 start_codon:yes stop_codon:yes gene_type:complete
MSDIQTTESSVWINPNGRITDKFFIKLSTGYQLIDSESRLTPLELNKRSLLLMFQENWDTLFDKAKMCSITKGQRITNTDLEVFYSQMTSSIPTYCYQGYPLTQAYTLLNEFIAYQNNNFQTQTTTYPMPPKAVKAKVNTLSVESDWIKNGKKVSSILTVVDRHWLDTDCYTETQIIGWLIFSAMIYGGINDKKTLVSYINTIREPTKRQPFINFNIISHGHYKNRKYGNEYVTNNLYCNQQIVLDPVTRCWLIRLNDCHSKARMISALDELIHETLTETGIESILKTTLTPLLVKQSIKTPTLAFMLSNSSYIWEMLPDVNVDQALVTVMKGKQDTVGLTKKSFERLLHQKYQPIKKVYENKEFLDLEIIVSNGEDEKKPSRRQADDELDLIKALKNILHKKYEHQNKSKSQSNIIDELLKISHDSSSLSYKILIRWVLSLVEKKGINNESISKYITAIGYEWLTFTKDQPLKSWTTEYFEELYDEILDDMAVKDLSYPAKRLQAIHKFAEVEYGFPKVKVPLTSSQRKIRSEWFSPQLFSALIEQMRIGIDIVEADMLTILFTIAYRTGMRKKEILGLKYADIEGMQRDKPSVMVRPNHYRSIKTDKSIREVPLFALLKPSELALFIKFITINKTKNDQRFIFTLSSSHIPLADHVPIKLLKLLHKDIEGSDHIGMTFHGFRHTAMTNLALVMQGHPDLVMSMTDYNEEDIECIKKGLLGENTCGSDLWYSCAHLFGHLSPDRGFEYYNHTAWLMASYSLSQASIRLPYSTFKNITGIDKKQLKENGYKGDTKNIDLQKIRKLLYRQVLNKDYRSPKQFAIQENINNTVVANAQDDSRNMLLQRYGLRRIIGFLEDMVEDKNVDNVAAKYDINRLHAQQYFDNAMRIHGILSTRGQKRFFAETDTIKLTPSLLKSGREQKILSHFFTNATTVRDQKNEQWNQFIMIAASKMSTSRPSINFSIKDMNAAVDFIKLGAELIEDKYWLVRGNEEIMSLFKKELSGYPGLKFETYKPDNIISLGIHNPNSKKNSKKNSNIEVSNYEYSPLLRFAIHLTLILDLDNQFLKMM